MGSVPRLRGNKEPDFIVGQPPSLLNLPTGCRFKDRCPERFDKCDQDPPTAKQDGHLVKCWLYSENREKSNGNESSEEGIRNTAGVTSDDIKTKNGKVLLSIQDLHVWFELRRFGFGHAGYVHAVDGVNFDLNYGEAIAVVGESGCGKSSLMKTILGL